MSNDPQYNNIPLLVTFLKSYKRAYLGLDEQGDTAAAVKEGSPEEELVPTAFREKFRKAFEDYFVTAGKALVKGQTVSSDVSLIDTDRTRLTLLVVFCRNCSSRTSGTRKLISKQEKSLRTVSTHTNV